jgi:hypothetical protein
MHDQRARHAGIELRDAMLREAREAWAMAAA